MRSKMFYAMFAMLVSAAHARTGNFSEISVDLKLDEITYVVGERIRGVVDIKSVTTDVVSAGYADSPDRFFIEVYRAASHEQLQRLGQKKFTAPFLIKANEGQKLETYLGDHYHLLSEGRYLARPVLVHGGYRYEGQYRAFDVIGGMDVAKAVQMFSTRKNLRRTFTLVRWSRNGYEHLFLRAEDSYDDGANSSVRRTTDIGPFMKSTQPTISIMPGGEVVVIHRNGADSFVRSEFWSLPDELDFRSRTSILDPETAGQQRVRQIYEEAGGVQPVDKPWWKFW